MGKMNELVITAHLELPHEWDVSQQEVRFWTRQAHPLEVLQWLINKAEEGRESTTLLFSCKLTAMHLHAPQTLPCTPYLTLHLYT